MEDLETILSTELFSEDERDEIDTLGGLVFAIGGRVPSRGELLSHASGLEFEVLDVDPRRIKRLRVRVPRELTHGVSDAHEVAAEQGLLTGSQKQKASGG